MDTYLHTSRAPAPPVCSVMTHVRDCGRDHVVIAGESAGLLLTHELTAHTHTLSPSRTHTHRQRESLSRGCAQTTRRCRQNWHSTQALFSSCIRRWTPCPWRRRCVVMLACGRECGAGRLPCGWLAWRRCVVRWAGRGRGRSRRHLAPRWRRGRRQGRPWWQVEC